MGCDYDGRRAISRAIYAFLKLITRDEMNGTEVKVDEADDRVERTSNGKCRLEPYIGYRLW